MTTFSLSKEKKNPSALSPQRATPISSQDSSQSLKQPQLKSLPTSLCFLHQKVKPVFLWMPLRRISNHIISFSVHQRMSAGTWS